MSGFVKRHPIAVLVGVLLILVPVLQVLFAFTGSPSELSATVDEAAVLIGLWALFIFAGVAVIGWQWWKEKRS